MARGHPQRARYHEPVLLPPPSLCAGEHKVGPGGGGGMVQHSGCKDCCLLYAFEARTVHSRTHMHREGCVYTAVPLKQNHGRCGGPCPSADIRAALPCSYRASCIFVVKQAKLSAPNAPWDVAPWDVVDFCRCGFSATTKPWSDAAVTDAIVPPPPPCSYANVPNEYGPYAYCSLDTGVACAPHIQLPRGRCRTVRARCAHGACTVRARFNVFGMVAQLVPR